MSGRDRDVDPRWMAAAAALAERGVGRTWPNPSVGCVIVRDGRVIGRGVTGDGGRPHAEARALRQAGEVAGATVYVTLEPCAHESARGPACADLLAAARPARVVIAHRDPDPRTDGKGAARLREAGIDVAVGVGEAVARPALAGFLRRRREGRPEVTLKLATSLDGRIATASGESRWITGERARAHAHVERARADAILVGRGTWETDRPRLDVRLAGLDERRPVRVILSSSCPRAGGDPASSGGERQRGPRLRGDKVTVIRSPLEIAALPADTLLIEGGAKTAASFLAADLVDRLLLYRAPILIGDGIAALGEIGLGSLDAAHGQWRLADARMLGSDRLEVYQRRRG